MSSKFGGIAVQADATSAAAPSQSQFGGIPVGQSAAPKQAAAPQSEASPVSDYIGDMANTFGSDVSGSWDQLKNDYIQSTGGTEEQKKQWAAEPFWDQMKDSFHQSMATGRLPMDALGVATSPITGAADALIAKPYADAVSKVMPFPKGREKEGEQARQELQHGMLTALSMAMPEKGVSLAGAGSRIPTVANLRDVSRKAYSAVDNSGVTIKPEVIKNLHDTIATDLKDRGYHPKLMPRTEAALGEIERVAKAGGTHSIQDMEILRRIAGHAAQSTEPSDRFMGRVIQDHIDDAVGNLGQQHVTPGTGDPKATVEALQTAREAWNRASKGEILENAIDKAHLNSHTFSASGYENALRGQFRKIANNDRAMKRFSKDEQAAIRKVAEGGSVENILRFLGKFAVRGPGSAAVSIGGGAAFGGPHGAAILPALGEVGRAGATIMTNRNANRAAELVLGGGQAGPAAPALPSAYAPVAAGNASDPGRDGSFDPEQPQQ